MTEIAQLMGINVSTLYQINNGYQKDTVKMRSRIISTLLPTYPELISKKFPEFIFK
jgi:hypothetical protein